MSRQHEKTAGGGPEPREIDSALTEEQQPAKAPGGEAGRGGGGEPPPQCTTVRPAPAPAVGDRVVLEGLVSRSDLNGKAGVVTALDLGALASRCQGGEDWRASDG